MKTLTKKYIFECKLKGVPVEVGPDLLYHKEILELLVTTGVWKKDPAGTSKFWDEYAFTVLHPVKLIDSVGRVDLLLEGYHHFVCL